MKLRAALLALVLVGCGSKEKEAPRVDPAPTAPTPTETQKGEPLPKLADNAPEDKPTSMRGTPEQEAKIAALEAESKKTYPDAKTRYLKGLPAGEHFFVTTMLTIPGRQESVFISVTGIKDGKVSGTIASDILQVSGYKAGDAYELLESAISDWLIAKADGSEEGNIVGKYLDTMH
jgi:hypothetical protein